MKSSRSPKDEAVAEYFHTHAKDFDTIYDTEKSWARRIRDGLTRGVVARRLDFVDDLAARHSPGRVVDVGCGSGRMAIRLAARGAVVVGLDFAPDMLKLARVFAAEAGMEDRCTFLEADFLTWPPSDKFDLSVALGVFDYVSNPATLLAKMAEVSDGKVVASFPRRLHPLVPLRFLRLRASGCPVYFYSRWQVEALAQGVLPRFRVESFGRDFMLVGTL
jgi:ubiquinone/menaquinone biosynthesis C-methylase UbiE